jgi:hypothetical protein
MVLLFRGEIKKIRSSLSNRENGFRCLFISPQVYSYLEIKMAKKKTKKLAWGFSSDSQNILDKYLPKFEKYIRKKQWLKAEKILEELEQRFPSKKEVFECWLTLAYEKGDWHTYQQKATEYSLKHPDEPDVYLTLSAICLQNSYPLLALEALQTFAEKFPNHREIAEANQKIKTIQTIVPELLQDYDLEEQKALDIAILNERGRSERRFNRSDRPVEKSSLC